MNWPLIALLSLIFCLIVISIVILRKFPALAILDVDNIPGEKESRFKEDIIKKRLERNLSRWSGWLGRVWLFLKKIFSDSLDRALESLRERQLKHQRHKKLTLSQRRERVRELFTEADKQLDDEEFEAAEESLIEIIRLEPKNLGAFWCLAEVYGEAKRWSEARSTLEHSLKLYRSLKWSYPDNPDITRQKIYFELALASESLDEAPRALDEIQEALELEPNNPRYLNLGAELALAADKLEIAQALIKRLREVNPDNAKVGELEELIAQKQAGNTGLE